MMTVLIYICIYICPLYEDGSTTHMLTPGVQFLTKTKLHPSLIFCTFTVVLFYQSRNGNVRQRRKTEGVPTLSRRVVQCLGVICDSLVPDKHSPRLIPDSALEVLTLGNMIEQKVQDAVRLFLIVPNCRIYS